MPQSLLEFLDSLSSKADDSYGLRMRKFFADNRGSSELGMLASPTKDEIRQLKKAVSIMTESELSSPAGLTDEQVSQIALDAGIDAAIFAIFINGYVISCSRQQ